MRNHARETLACDFFVAVTVEFRLVYVFLALEIAEGLQLSDLRHEAGSRFR